MIRFLITVLLLLPVVAKAEKPSCEFRSREAFSTFLTKMPKSVIGYANCYEREPKASVFYIARLENAADEKAFLLSHAKLIIRSGISSRVTKESFLPSGLHQIMVETKREAGTETMSHFAFSLPQRDGSRLIFVHTIGIRATHQMREKLAELRDHLMAKPFQVQLAPATQNVVSLLPSERQI